MKIRTLLVTGAALSVVAIPSAAIATGEGQPVEGGERNPSSNASLAYSRETEIISDNASYGTRQSNKRDGDGGGAIYGCRSNPGNEPCVRASNLKGGRAFEFATAGKEAGRITVADATGAPLTTNATGVASGFNADKVDGREGAELASAGDLKFASVGVDGKLNGGRGATAAAVTSEDNNTYTVTFDRDVSACSFTASALGGSTEEALGVTPATGENAKNAVVVDQQDDTGAGATETGRGFHLQVIC